MFLFRCPCCRRTYLLSASHGDLWVCPASGVRRRFPAHLSCRCTFTEAQWVNWSEPNVLSTYLERAGTDRKRRLLLCAFCRLLWGRLDGPSRSVVLVAERFADGRLASRREMERARRHVERLVADTLGRHRDGLPSREPALALSRAVSPWPWCHSEAVTEAERRAHCALIRDVFGNPFRLVLVLQSWLAWDGGTVVKLARAIYEEGAFDRLPILADALEDAGCTDAALLNHCRHPGVHARGCWALDAILGKE